MPEQQASNLKLAFNNMLRMQREIIELVRCVELSHSDCLNTYWITMVTDAEHKLDWSR